MGYIKHTDQRGVTSGYIKYRFELRIKGNRYRKIITCRKSTVQILYKDWEEYIIAGETKQYKFFEIANEYLDYSKKVKSKRMYQHEWRVLDLAKQFFGNKDISEFRRRDAEDFIIWRKGFVLVNSGNIRNKNQLSAATLNRSISTMAYLFNWCIRREYYSRNNPFGMCKVTERNYREVSLNREQIALMLREAYNISSMLCNTILFALLTGMRRGEIFSLEWGEVSLEYGRILLSEKKTKGKRARVVPISPALNQLLVSIHKSDRLVMSDYTMDQLKHQWTRLVERLPFGVNSDNTKLRFHDLRHLTAQTLLNEGLDIVDVQHILGHRDVTTTQRRYSQFARPDLIEKGSRIDNILPFKKIV